MPGTDPQTRPPKDWALRARRLELLCALAAETAGMVEFAPVWAGVCGRLPEVLDARAAALRTQLQPGVSTWEGEGAAPAGAALALAAATGDDPEGPEWIRVGGLPALRLPLRGGSEPLGTLALAWSEEPADPEETLAVASLLAALTASALAGVRAYLRLTETAYRRERFFSAMSHDLRTPITAIVGYSELLADGIVGGLSRQQQEMVERISQVSGHLAQLVNDILDLAKLDAGRMEFHTQEVRLADLIEEALVGVEPQARSKGLALRVAPDGMGERTVRVDAPRVRQILVNLLSNAIKFTDAGEVVLSAGEDEGRPWIEVRDTGPGLPPGSEEDLFEEFLQLATGTKNKREPGSGLGLAISRRLARAMGGDLTARDAEGAGAAFTLVLPADGG